MFSGALREQPEPLKHNGVPPVTMPAPLLWENIKYEKRPLFQILNFRVLLPYFLYNARALAESKLAHITNQ